MSFSKSFSNLSLNFSPSKKRDKETKKEKKEKKTKKEKENKQEQSDDEEIEIQYGEISDVFSLPISLEILRANFGVPTPSRISLKSRETGRKVGDLSSLKSGKYILLVDSSTAVSLTSKDQALSKIKSFPHSPSTLSSKPKLVESATEWLKCHRNGNSPSLPTTLREKILGLLYDDLKGISNELPTHEDCTFALRLCQSMSKTFLNEEHMTNAFNEWSNDTAFPTHRQDFVKGRTDGSYTLQKDQIRALILNREDKYDGCNADIQNLMYFSMYWAEAGRNKLRERTNCPSILVSFQGTDLTISGAVLTEEGVCSDYYHSTSILPIDYDLPLRKDLARTVMALRRACAALSEYYLGNEVNPSASDEFPYPRLIGDMQIQYTQRIAQDKLVWKGIGPNGPIIIKFTREYCFEAHQNCTLAPQLLAHQKIPGGWIAIVMQEIEGPMLADIPKADRTHHKRELYDSILAMHAAGFVHGDLREPNIIISNATEKPVVLDFDWAGPIGIARYPCYLNIDGRSSDATDCGLIEPEHDLFMINRMFV